MTIKKQIDSYLKNNSYFKVIDVMNKTQFEVSPYKIKVLESKCFPGQYDLKIDYPGFETLYHINVIRENGISMTIKDINKRKLHLLPIYIETKI